MRKSVASKDIDLESLSSREQEVVARAVDGYTDEQIAQSLGIGLGTVNTYWVRLRTKIGPYSRTEIVGLVLRREMERRVKALQEELLQLRLDQSPKERKPTLERAIDEESWRFLTVGHLNEPVLVVRESGDVLFVNPPAAELLGCSRQRLEGVPFWKLTLAGDGSSCEQGLHDFFGNQEVRRITLGLNAPYYVRHCEGSLIQVTISAAWFESPDGVIAVVSLRRYPDENSAVGSPHDSATMR